MEKHDLKKPMNKQWFWHPNLPVEFYPYFEWPLKPKKLINFILRLWLQKSDRTIFLALSFLTFYVLMSSIEDMVILETKWISKIVFRNLILFIIVAGGLHWWFYTFKGQGMKFKYDSRNIKKKNKLFSFGDHIYDNIFWSVISGISIWVGYEVLLLWSFASGKIEIFQFSDGWIWFIIWFPLLQIWQSFHFYCWHRLLHIRILYKLFHHIHHRNINPGPLSGYSMHPVEHSLMLSSVLIHFVIPSHPIHILYHLYWIVLGTISTHSGFEQILVKNKNILQVGSFFHHIHHRYFNCNYGNPEIPFDKWFGSYNNGTKNT